MNHSQLLVLFLLTVYSFSIFGCKEYNQSDFGGILSLRGRESIPSVPVSSQA